MSSVRRDRAVPERPEPLQDDVAPQLEQTGSVSASCPPQHHRQAAGGALADVVVLGDVEQGEGAQAGEEEHAEPGRDDDQDDGSDAQHVPQCCQDGHGRRVLVQDLVRVRLAVRSGGDLPGRVRGRWGRLLLRHFCVAPRGRRPTWSAPLGRPSCPAGNHATPPRGGSGRCHTAQAGAMPGRAGQAKEYRQPTSTLTLVDSTYPTPVPTSSPPARTRTSGHVRQRGSSPRSARRCPVRRWLSPLPARSAKASATDTTSHRPRVPWPRTTGRCCLPASRVRSTRSARMSAGRVNTAPERAVREISRPTLV